jgi:hypothetical protein
MVQIPCRLSWRKTPFRSRAAKSRLRNQSAYRTMWGDGGGAIVRHWQSVKRSLVFGRFFAAVGLLFAGVA